MHRALALLGVTTALLVAAVHAGSTGAAGRSTPIPILMYHAIAKAPSGTPYPTLYVPKPEFAAEMAALARRGYRAVTLTQAYDHWEKGAPLPGKPIVLTFDDGYRNVYENGFPILRKRRWPGVLNLEVRFMNKPWGLARSRIRRLLSADWELASHTIHHRDLTGLTDAELTIEVLDSRFLLQRLFRVPVLFFCYPAGRYNAEVVREVKAAGYAGATSTRSGLARPSELYALARIRVDGGDGASGLLTKLDAYGG
jgi:peptidoglycan/xylan/chitin deacetylase (PgdA/CDA1 family)